MDGAQRVVHWCHSLTTLRSIASPKVHCERLDIDQTECMIYTRSYPCGAYEGVAVAGVSALYGIIETFVKVGPRIAKLAIRKQMVVRNVEGESDHAGSLCLERPCRR